MNDDKTTSVFAPWSRRQMLHRSGLGLGAIALNGLMQQLAAGENSPNPLLPKTAHFPAKAKHLIHIFANGGPSHIDTWDPKPKIAEYEGKELPGETPRTERKTGALYPSIFKFKQHGQSGLWASELFEKTASAHADKLCVVRSMHADVPNHEPSLLLMNCGEPRLVRPSLGSWLTYGLGTDNQNLPAFIAMCPGGYPIQESQNWQAGFLPGIYQGTYIDTKHESVEKLVENVVNRKLSRAAQRRELDIIQRMNAEHASSRTKDPMLEARIQSMELAYRMQEEAMDVFDVSKEPKHILEMYGPGVQGRQMLIARKLIQRGVRVVQLWHGQGQPWDNHDKISQGNPIKPSRRYLPTWNNTACSKRPWSFGVENSGEHLPSSFRKKGPTKEPLVDEIIITGGSRFGSRVVESKGDRLMEQPMILVSSRSKIACMYTTCMQRCST
jgi:hypothetical protein